MKYDRYPDTSAKLCPTQIEKNIISSSELSQVLNPYTINNLSCSNVNHLSLNSLFCHDVVPHKIRKAGNVLHTQQYTCH